METAKDTILAKSDNSKPVEIDYYAIPLESPPVSLVSVSNSKGESKSTSKNATSRKKRIFKFDTMPNLNTKSKENELNLNPDAKDMNAVDDHVDFKFRPIKKKRGRPTSKLDKENNTISPSLSEYPPNPSLNESTSLNSPINSSSSASMSPSLAASKLFQLQTVDPSIMHGVSYITHQLLLKQSSLYNLPKLSYEDVVKEITVLTQSIK